jgi:hypothetical protein
MGCGATAYGGEKQVKIEKVARKLILETIERHITQGPYKPRSGEVVSNKRFITTGSTYGRVLFTEHAPMLLIKRNVQGVSIRDCEFNGGGRGTAIHIESAVLIPARPNYFGVKGEVNDPVQA